MSYLELAGLSLMSGSAMTTEVLDFGATRGVSLSLCRPLKTVFTHPNKLCVMLWIGPLGVTIVKPVILLCNGIWSPGCVVRFVGDEFGSKKEKDQEESVYFWGIIGGGDGGAVFSQPLAAERPVLTRHACLLFRS